ncbi:Rieske (2Fe-2S) protein [Pseudomonas sp. N040]|uniref:Rieske (2Fe-2S) protein n=1 Tax=Pseudomonas sp. N040 TaxID=2785325 RepID=UPI0018A30CD7|nr:Rieske 2Fe-2S domain-containing protein [Pseudomonas sp. N040]MBF7729034.1 Rieske 2Fe-2S domain-containing protein [Pseudomonas sp. N040]MBW7012674.1 Rieske 2Fe-2S domain-containing protein [Pseudomonas sp. N040]
MTRRIEIPAGQLPASGARAALQIEDKHLALFNVDGSLFAIDDSCPHQGASLLGGDLQGRIIQCRAHGLRFDLASGCMPNVTNFGVAAYPLDITEGRTFILLPDRPSRESAQ